MNFRAIQRLLSSCAFNPNEPGPMKVIVDVGDPNYYLNRAVEMIRESQNANLQLQPGEKWALRQRAISLLAINILREQDVREQGGNKRGKSHGRQVHQPEATQAPQSTSVQSGGSGSVGDLPSRPKDPEVRVQPQGQEMIDDSGDSTDDL